MNFTGGRARTLVPPPSESMYYDFGFFSSLPPQAGSAIRIRSLVHQLSQRGYRLLLTERGGPGDQPLRLPGLHHHLHSTEQHPLPVGIARSLAANLHIACSHRFRVALALKPLPNSALPALLAGRRGAHTVIDVDDLDYAYYRNRAAHAAVRTLFRTLPRRFRHVTTHNRFLAHYLRRDSGVATQNLLSLPQGIELEAMRSAQPDPALAATLGVDPAHTVAYLATLGLTTHFHDILPALARFTAADPSRRVLVIGDGNRRPEMEARVRACGAERSFVFVGQVDHAQVPGYLKLSALGLNYMTDSPANRCRASLKVREYLAAGQRVVCNPVGELQDLAELVFPFRHIAELPQVMERALAADMHQRAPRIERWLDDNCNWEHITDRFLGELFPQDEAPSSP